MSDIDYEEVRKLQTLCHRQAVTKGFYDIPVRKRSVIEEIRENDPEVADSMLRDYWGNNLMLIVTELAEGHEELRHGHDVAEAYAYWNNGTLITAEQEQEWVEGGDDPHKPEGVPSEIADVVIRCFDFADDNGIDLATAIEQKLAYNRTRSRLHGGKKF